jgi:putative tricarboxylic transport membrane protein
MEHIFTALVAGFLEVFSFPSFLYMLVGIVFGLFIGFIPGLGGNFVLAILLPFVFGMKATTALAFLLGAHAVVVTGGSISSILFGTPGSGPNAATVFDGYPMAQRGEGARAIGISMTASAAGGVFGALVLALLIPVLRPLVLAFAPPEFFMLSVLGITFIALVGTGSMLKSLLTGGFGLMLSFVGQELSTGSLRYTFDQLYLWEGIPLIPTVIGLFAVAEMIELAVHGGAIVQKGLEARGSPLHGMMDVVRHWALFLRASVIGTVIGIIPGLGGELANFLAYGHAVQSSKDRGRFGKGAPEGVIAPEAANNAKEGGALVPTLAFGIPGSSSMAILLGAFYILGLQPGPKMLTENLDIVFMLVWIVAVANVIGALIGLGFAKWLSSITMVRGSLMVPVIFVVALFGAFATNNSMGDILVAAGFGVLGYFMKKHHYSRATLVIGLVLGRITEKNLLLAMKLYGWSMFQRPLTLAMLVMILFILLYPVYQSLRRRWGT